MQTKMPKMPKIGFKSPRPKRASRELPDRDSKGKFKKTFRAKTFQAPNSMESGMVGSRPTQ